MNNIKIICGVCSNVSIVIDTNDNNDKDRLFDFLNKHNDIGKWEQTSEPTEIIREKEKLKKIKEILEE